MATPIPQNHVRFTLSELLEATGGRVRGPLGDAALSCEGVTTDTRALRPGELFVALRGERFDGHDHLTTAAERGAALALVERDVPLVEGLTLVRVPSTLEALGALATAHLTSWRAGGGKWLFAVTGSAGKTTTRRALAALLERLAPGEVHATAGNLNNLVGVPMTLLGLEHGHRHALVELGTSRRGEIPALARMTRPEAGIVTLVADAHSAGLGSIAEVAGEKGALFRNLRAGGLAVGNADDERVVAAMMLARRRVGYGFSASADVRITARKLVALDRSELTVVTRRSTFAFETLLAGRAGALACAAAIATVDGLFDDPLDPEVVRRAFAGLAADAGGRLEARRRPDGSVIIDDSYNSNPASAAASLEAAREIADHCGGRLLLVMGEMRELGPMSSAAHRILGERAAATRPALLVAVSGDARITAERATELGIATRFVDTAAEAAELAATELRPGDVLLVKGSRGVHTELVVQALAARGGAAESGRARHAGAAP